MEQRTRRKRSRNVQRHARSLVVIGGGIAGVSCVEELTALCPSDHVTLVSASSVLKGAKNVVRLTDHMDNFDVVEQPLDDIAKRLSRSGATGSVRAIQARVCTIDARSRNLTLDDGRKLGYDRACICTGARPRLVAPAALAGGNIIGLRDNESVEELNSRLLNARRVVVVGNGGIALELVNALRAVRMTHWVVKDSYIGNVFFDASASAFVAPQLFRDAATMAGRVRGRDGNVAPACAATGGSEGSMVREPAAQLPPSPPTQSAAHHERDGAIGGSALGPQWLRSSAVLEWGQRCVERISAAHTTALSGAPEPYSCACHARPGVTFGVADSMAGLDTSLGQVPNEAVAAPDGANTAAAAEQITAAPGLRVHFECELRALRHRGGAWVPVAQTRATITSPDSSGQSSAAAQWQGDREKDSICDGKGEAISKTQLRREDQGPTPWPLEVKLTNKCTIGCDFLVSATGVQPILPAALVPDGSFPLAGQDSQMAGGLLVDERMQLVNWPGSLFAAGDCCACTALEKRSGATPDLDTVPGADVSATHWFQMRLWSQARSQGRLAAYGMAEGGVDCSNEDCAGEHDDLAALFPFELFTHATRFFGFPVALLGQFNGQLLPPEKRTIVVQQVATPEGLVPAAEGKRLAQGYFDAGTYVSHRTATTLRRTRTQRAPSTAGRVTPWSPVAPRPDTNQPSFKAPVFSTHQHVMEDATAALNATYHDERAVQEGSSLEASHPEAPTSEVQVLVRVTPGVEYVKLVLLKGRVIGAMLIGTATELAETFENLILNRLDVSAFGEDLLDPNVDIEDYFD